MAIPTSLPGLGPSIEKRRLPIYFTLMKIYRGVFPRSQQMGAICWAGRPGSVLWWEIALQLLAIPWKHL